MDQHDPQSVPKNVGSKIIEVGGRRAFFTLKAELKATLCVALRYTSDEIHAIKEYAQSD